MQKMGDAECPALRTCRKIFVGISFIF